ncbi:MAG: DUF4340 domain-containing protein [Ignavibacteriae bacterium]|nr:DUF4340 domain-containing protein [Ignavibacteriota bacterium]
MNRSTVILIGLLLILGAITYFILPSEEERQRSDDVPQVSFAIDSASVVKLEIHQKAKSLTIENIGGKWTITSPIHVIADPNPVKQIISGMKKFKVGSLISSNPEKQSIFQVDTTGTKLILTERSGKTTSLIVGKMGPSFSEVYFRLPDEKNVYLGEGIDSWTLNREVKDWRDKTIFSTVSDSIKMVTYTHGSKQYVLQRDTTVWKIGEKEIELSTINPLLTSLNNLRADDFIDTAMKFPSLPITVDIKGNEQLRLNLYPSLPDSSRYYVQASTTPQLFVIGKYAAQQLLKPLEQTGSLSKVTHVASVQKEKPLPTTQEEIVRTEKEQVPPQPRVTERKESPKPAASDQPVSQPPRQQRTTRRTQQQESQRTQVPPPPPTGQRGARTQTETSSSDDEGELTVHTVQRGETMTSIAQKYNVSVEQVMKWNLLKSIAVRPGQELYIYVRK